MKYIYAEEARDFDHPFSSLCCSSDPPLKFNQKYLHLCSEDERRSYGVGTARGWV